MGAAVRTPAGKLSRESIPDRPGVYAFFRSGQAKYVGTTASLRTRVWKKHLGQSSTLRGSALRRTLCSAARENPCLDHALPSRVAHLYDEHKRSALERELKAEFKPRLTKR